MQNEWEYDSHNKFQTCSVATVVSKLLEHVVLSRFFTFLGTTDNQFDVKAGHGTDECTFLLQQTPSYFVTRGSSVHAGFLNASKAFDRVLHITVFEKLIQRNVPMCFVRLLKHSYKEQKMQIKWDKHLSEAFHVTNGVRQGGVLSLYLFTVYLGKYWVRTCLLCIKSFRWFISWTKQDSKKHLIFADDICVFLPSVRRLQSILEVCQP